MVWDTFFSFLTSLASGGVTSKLGSIVVLPGCGDDIGVSRLMGALSVERYVTDVCPCLVNVLNCCGWCGFLILRFRVVGGLWPSSSCYRPRLPSFTECFVAVDVVSMILCNVLL